jgi:lipopolysaccharide biosynthesis glycosyltransferase
MKNINQLNQMRILLTFDTGYAPHAATVMESIIRNCPEKLDFVIIYYDLNQETQNILSQHFKPKTRKIEFVSLDKEILQNSINDVKTTEHLKGFNTYLRLFAPMLLPDDEVIYLDCDIIVQGNILEITAGMDLSKPICAMTEYNPAYKWQYLSRAVSMGKVAHPWVQEAYWYRTYQNLEMDATASYFNAGVMVINLEYWREHKVAEKAIAFLLNHPEKCYAADQDALNHAINGNYSTLAPHWNTVASPVFSGYTEKQIQKASKNPCIIHTVGGVKHWHYMCFNRNAKKLYRQYRKLTPYPEFGYSDKNLANILKYQVKSAVKLVLPGTLYVILQNLVYKEIPCSRMRLRHDSAKSAGKIIRKVKTNIRVKKTFTREEKPPAQEEQKITREE